MLKHIFYFLLYSISISRICVFTQEPISKGIDVKGISKGINEKSPTIQSTTIESPKGVKNGDQIISIPLGKTVNSNPESFGNILPFNNRLVTSQFVLEGGDVINQRSTTLPDKANQGIVSESDVSHSKGSKGRKGVQYPGPSIVARKGVDQPQLLSSNNSVQEVGLPLRNGLPSKGTTTATESNKMFLNNSGLPNNQSQKISSNNKTVLKISAKKPETVSDIEDVNDFEEYGIKTSTTGEDYIIIGIVIVLGIWCSIFGALIFYRRAGEYWDRRHYRRMDFLVEGMYND